MLDIKDRGQVGIGTLIVFIAMVLVAAIAGAVLIDTAGYLQGKSENAGVESSQQVTNRLHLINIWGDDIDTTDDTVGNVSMVVTIGPGSAPINLENVTMQWVGPDGADQLTALQDPRFAYEPVKDSDGSFPVLSSSDDRAKIQLDLDDEQVETGPAVEPLRQGETAKLLISTSSGGTLEIRLSVPEKIQQDDNSVKL